MENVLESIGVTKNYAGKAAVDNVSLKLETGLVYAMLGPNGSGKTTWMKMVAGLVKPGKGENLYKGKAIGNRSIQSGSFYRFLRNLPGKAAGKFAAFLKLSHRIFPNLA